MTAPTSPALVESKLEELFLRVEEESEKRAEELLYSASTDSSSLGTRHKRRGSVAITRFGQLSEDPNDSESLTAIAAKSSIYHSPLNNNSASSLGSHHDGDTIEDEHHVTHIHQIVPKQSLSRAVGGILAKKSRSRSGSVLSTTGEPGNMMIGVSVLEATVESSEGEQPSRSTGMVVVGGGTAGNTQLKSKSSRLSLLQGKNLLARAKSLRDKLVRAS